MELSDVIFQWCVLAYIRCCFPDYLSSSQPIHFKICAEFDSMYNLYKAFLKKTKKNTKKLHFFKKTYVFKHVENTIIFILWKNPSYKLFFYNFTIYMPIFVKIGLFLLSQSGKRQTCSFKIVVLVYIMLISLTQKWSYVA